MRHPLPWVALAAIALTPPAYATVAPGLLDPDAIHHRLAMPDRNRLADDLVTLRVAARRGDVTRASLLIQALDGTFSPVPMERFASTSKGDSFRVALRPKGELLSYGFWLEDKKGGHFYGADGLSELPGKPFSWTWKDQAVFRTPEWAHGTVFYQIFPERFGNGDRRNDPPHAEAWGGKPRVDNFFGGDLQGVRDHLGYLSQLGVEALYFNPIFESTSNHKYNTTDYLKIDPHFGTEDDFRTLARDAHARGMKIMLDGVFNHTGTNFWAFQEAMKKGPKSPYWHWYTFDGFPVTIDPKPNYRAWWGFSSLPQLNNINPEVRDYLLKVGRYWIGPDMADAWRLDVPNEVPRDYWIRFREAVHDTNPEGLIVGEIWDDASQWLAGDNFDSVMNYRFRSAVLDFVAYEKTDATAFGDALDQIQVDYGDQVEPVLLNLLDSHDTARFLHEAGEDKAKLRLAVLLQMTMPGMPCIYYGDEVGMTGAGDPDCRRCMEWDSRKQDRELLHDYQAMIRLRKEHPALRNGAYERLETSAPRVAAYLRREGKERYLVVVNAGKTPFDVTTLGLKTRQLIYGSLNHQQLAGHQGAVLQLE
jgi:glycosidase